MPLPPPLTDLPWYAFAALPAIVLAAYTVFGATGFGSAIVAVPLFAHWLPLTFAVPLVTALDVFAATALAVRQRRDASRPEMRRLLPPVLIGIALGTAFIVNVPRGPALLALGVFVTAYAVYLAAGPRAMRRAPAWLAWPIGGIGGVFSAMFGTGGPLYMVFLSARLRDKAALRATAAAVVGTSVWIRLALFAATGLFANVPLLALAVVLLPVMAAGVRLGHRLHGALSTGAVLRLVALLLAGNGVSLVVRTLAAAPAG